jgi:hypothetical protein
MSEDMNPLGLDASAFVPQEATDAFARTEIVVSCVMGPGKGAERRCSLIISADPPSDIPYRNLGVNPSSAACALGEVPQVVEGLLKEQEAAFGEAWVKAWTEQQKLKTKAKARSKSSSTTSPKPQEIKAELFEEEPEEEDLDADEEETEIEAPSTQPQSDDAAEEAPESHEEEEAESPEDQPAEEDQAPAAEAVREPAQMSILGGIEL